MIEIRIHGRGGQGAVIASLLVAHAAHSRGYHVQVFPEFGVERRGVPVTAFARLDERPIRLRAKITTPDHVLVLDPALARYLPVTAGLAPGGSLVMNGPDARVLEPFENGWRLAWVDATGIAARHEIGTATSPIVNTTMVGAFAAATRIFGKVEIETAMQAIFPKAAAKNTAAAMEAYESLQLRPDPVAGAIQQLYAGGLG